MWYYPYAGATSEEKGVVVVGVSGSDKFKNEILAYYRCEINKLLARRIHD